MNASVANAAGTLPMAKRRTMRQSTVLCLPCTSVPTDLVTQAYSRSVPTAAVGWMPNSSTRIGVMSEPPPTPVCPTSKPTRKPENEKSRLCDESSGMRKPCEVAIF